MICSLLTFCIVVISMMWKIISRTRGKLASLGWRWDRFSVERNVSIFNEARHDILLKILCVAPGIGRGAVTSEVLSLFQYNRASSFMLWITAYWGQQYLVTLSGTQEFIPSHMRDLWLGSLVHTFHFSSSIPIRKLTAVNIAWNNPFWGTHNSAKLPCK